MILLAFFAGLFVLAVVFSYAQFALASPVLGIVNRWIRWALFSVSVAVGAQYCFASDRPEWLWVATGFLVWPLVETMYTWLAIKAFSHSPWPLFPRFAVNREGDAWPNQRRFLVLRDWLRQQKFRHQQSLKADRIADHQLRVSVFHDADAHIRLQIMFFPQGAGNLTVCFVYSSITQAGARLVTDNIFMPYGGFYPANWEVERRPWTRSPGALLQRHRQRLAECTDPLQAFADEPLHDLNSQQHQLECTNTELGFLFPRNLHEEFGRLTWEGRYRVWKEAWLLSYFGLTGR
ncbi:MAG: hypothetical protein ABSH19_01570 [Opitutales bacterium]|jgi:hypothetical protein